MSFRRSVTFCAFAELKKLEDEAVRLCHYAD